MNVLTSEENCTSLCPRPVEQKKDMILKDLTSTLSDVEWRSKWRYRDNSGYNYNGVMKETSSTYIPSVLGELP